MVDSWFLSFPIIIGLAVCVLTDQLQLVAKVNGSLKNKVARYNSAMKIMVVNRLGAVLLFFYKFALHRIGSQSKIYKYYLHFRYFAFSILNWHCVIILS